MTDARQMTLRTWMQAEPRDLAAVLRVGRGVAIALGAMHQQHLVYNHLRPEHIVLAPPMGEVSLLAPSAPELARSGGAWASELGYAAPERSGRMNRRVDARSDLYSLGVVLYEMLTSELPFATTDPAELVHSHIARTPRSPRDCAKEVPAMVSALVMKLLRKAGEERYATALGLVADLDVCLTAWESAGEIPPFPLGRLDRTGELRLDQRLKGRENELATLLAAWQRASRGKSEVVLITGSSGVGKSALVDALRGQVARARGVFVAGKFDQGGRSVPYAEVAQAFRELVRRVLMQSRDGLARDKERVALAVGNNGKLLTEIIPELSRLLGPQPDVPELPPAEARNRFAVVFQRFLRVFTTPDRPLTIFLDDLQWADPGSLTLLELMVAAPGSEHLLVIGAYRDIDLDAGHPLSRTLREIGGRAAVARITLGPLGRGEVTALVAEVLGTAPPAVEILGQLVFEKTRGNPFFVVQLLTMIHKEGLLAFDASAGAFRWDLEVIRQRMITDDVADLMIERISRLDPGAQRSLSLAACVGHRFDLETLSALRQASAAEVNAEIGKAVREGVIVQVESELGFGAGAPGEAFAQEEPEEPTRASYRFLHDRVQQAAYSLLVEEEKPAIHLQIGRLLRDRGGALLEELFEVVTHLNLGASRILAPTERLLLARLNFAAGKKAQRATAYQAAASYFAAGGSLLEEATIEQEYELWFALHMQRAECEVLLGEFAAAEALLDVLSKSARTPLSRARILGLRIVRCSALGKAGEAQRLGIEALRALGIELFDTEEARGAVLADTRAAVEEGIKGRVIAELIHAPRLIDPDKQAALELLTHLSAPAYLTTPNLFTLIVLHQVKISFEHGNADISPYAYMLHGFMLATECGQYAEADEFGKLALALNDKLGNAALTCKLYFLYAVFAHLLAPLQSVLPYFERACEAGLGSGDFVYLSYACSQRLLGRLGAGDPLSSVREETDRFLELMQRTNIASSRAAQTIVKQVIANLEGRTSGRDTLSDEGFDEAMFLATIERQNLRFPMCWYYTAKLQLAFLYGQTEVALDMLERASRSVAGSVGFYFTTELSFYACLTLLVVDPASGGPASERRREALSTLSMHASALAGWAESCPANYLSKHLLVEAERARVAGETYRAIELYERAIKAADAHGCGRDAALANELCARFQRGRGEPKLARVYLMTALDGYARWGAWAKVAHLEEQVPALERLNLDGRMGASVATRGSEEAQKLTADPLDMPAVVHALSALAGEIVLDRLLDRFMRIVARHAGAQRGFLVLFRHGELRVEAALTVDPDEVTVGLSSPLEGRDDLAVSIVQYVAQVEEPLVLGDATHEARFVEDPYILRRRPRSVAALCLLRQGRCKGVLYLENDAAHDVFTTERMELLGLLSSQAAAAVESASLYADLREATEALSRANTALEGKVEDRTIELSRANERLTLELHERERAEAARAALQDEIQRVNAERVLELSTPLIPISERIVVMPLIGTMDSGRAEQVLHVALEGVHARRARFVILDLTGLRLVDAGVASALSRTAGALRLLGAETIITGMDAAMAQRLVGVGADLGRLVTHGTLESGITYALSRGGQAWVSARGVVRAEPGGEAAFAAMPEQAGRRRKR